MLKIFIGRNAVGKTVYLKNCMKSCKSDFGTNLDTTDGILSLELSIDKERLSILRDVLMAKDIQLMGSLLVCTDSAYDISEQFMRVATIVCQDAPAVYLDEPELKLSREEVSLLVEFLSLVLSKTEIDMYITTHNNAIVNIRFGKDVYEVVNVEDTASVVCVREGDVDEVLDSI